MSAPLRPDSAAADPSELPGRERAAPRREALSSALAAGLDEAARGLLRRALAALARREYSRRELERRLCQGADPSPDAQRLAAVLDRLQAQGLLSDARMAESLVRSRGARYGRIRLARELERRGVDEETIARALTQASDDLALARRLWARRFGQLPSNVRERARQARFLAARGFPSEVIAHVLRARGDEPRAEDAAADPDADPS